MRSAVRFRLPPELEAAAPPEARGLRRDHVRLLVVDRASGAVAHHRFHELPQLLEPGDLLVANDSRTLPASLLGRTASGAPLEVRLAARDGARWAALALGVPEDGRDPALVPTDARPAAPELAVGDRLVFAGGLGATVLGRHEEAGPLVWLAFDAAGERLAEALHRAGRPVRYAYVPRPWPLHHYQTLFAAGPGSAEMASAGRPFTVQTLRDLRARGIDLATISLHAGLSTYGDPATDRRYVPAEPYLVPEATAAAVAACRAAGGRVIAVGTTVVRALETAALETAARALETTPVGAASIDPVPGSAPRWGSVADPETAGSRLSTAPPGPNPDPLRPRPDPEPLHLRADPEPLHLRAGPGVSRLRIGPGHRLRAVDGLLTGLHEPEASHLDLLGAFLDRAALDRAYAAALAGGYLWHEFGDICLLLPRRS
jgi:S-adenosylmethionine:tRNA ribosyltransferase-isomerase